ncbi:hypothetical protein OSTOST_06506 [Ostertagia ostertagi]
MVKHMRSLFLLFPVQQRFVITRNTDRTKNTEAFTRKQISDEEMRRDAESKPKSSQAAKGRSRRDSPGDWTIVELLLAAAMGRASFEYDEVGNTFYYVLVSFYAIILLPATYFFFPTGKVGTSIHFAEQLKVDEHDCQCHGCVKKRQQKEANRPWKRTKKILTVVVSIFTVFSTNMSNVHQS